MAKRQPVIYNEDLRDLGKNIARLAEPEYGQDFLGQLYLAACNSVDRNASSHEVDRRLVRTFAAMAKKAVTLNGDKMNSYETEIHEKAVQFLRKNNSLSSTNSIRLPGQRSLYQLTEDEAEKNGIPYHDTGRALSLSSETLTSKLEISAEELAKELPQANKYYLEERAVQVLRNYIAFQFSK